MRRTSSLHRGLQKGYCLFLAALVSGALSAPAEAQSSSNGRDPFGEGDSGVRPASSGSNETGESTDATGTTEQTPASPDARDDAVLGAQSTPFSLEPRPIDPLTIGGQLYLRAQVSALEKQRVRNYTFRMPSLLDVFLDARPNDRVRGFVLGRMTYDPMLPDSAPAPNLNSLGTGLASSGAFGFSGTAGSASLSSVVSAQTNAPQVLLDQLWIRFDLGHRLFITAGRQHVRWGTARFWMPADFLHFRRRNPLDVFDARTGTSMLKLHLPIESLAWNLYLYALTDNQSGPPTLASVAGAARAEFVLGSCELGLGTFFRYRARPKFAADLSLGLGPIDLYGEAAVLDASQVDRVGFVPDAVLPNNSSMQTPEELEETFKQTVGAIYPLYQVAAYRPQVVAGFSVSLNYNDKDTFTLGGEYFYNTLGYPSPDFYLGLMLPHTRPLHNPATFFYLGEHYAAVYASLPSPFKADLHTFTVSTLANLSDRSFITRFDYSLVLLTHLRFELFVAGHYGERNGEFRFGIDLLERPPALFDLGIALRMST